MPAEDVFFRLIEKTKSLLRSDRFLIVFMAPVNRDRTKALLAQFQNAGIIINVDMELGFAADSVRIGRRHGPDYAEWTMPEGAFRDVLILGSRAQIGLRVVRTAFSHGVRRFFFADPIEETLSSESIFVLGVRLVIRRIAATLVEAVLGLGSSQPRYQDVPWTKPISKARSFVVQQIKRVLEAVGLKRRQVWFVKTLETLFEFSDRASPGSVGGRPPSVVLAIGTVGPGGSERQVVNTALALAAEGQFRPIVVCTNLGGGASDFYRTVLEKAGVELVDLKKIDFSNLPVEHAQFVDACRTALDNQAFHISDDVMRLLAVLLKEQPSVLHSFLDDTNIKAGVAGVLARISRIALSLRSVAPNNFPLLTPFMQPGYEALLARPEIVFCCNSKAGAADYRLWLGKPNLPIKILENGIDFSQFVRTGTNAADRAKYGIPNDALVLGSVMRLTEEKQPMLWAKVVVEISRQIPDMHFVLVGDGPFKNDVLNFVLGSRFGSRMHFLGHSKEIPSVLNCLDLFLLTSRLEGLPNVLIEAQAMGVPVVTTPAGGAIETLDHGRTGLVAPDQTVIGVAQTCMQILNNSEFRERLSNAAPQFVRDKFSIEWMLNQTLELYTE
jgi:glycosyltransferase involved in cell wall biosynthesis